VCPFLVFVFHLFLPSLRSEQPCSKYPSILGTTRQDTEETGNRQQHKQPARRRDHRKPTKNGRQRAILYHHTCDIDGGDHGDDDDNDDDDDDNDSNDDKNDDDKDDDDDSDGDDGNNDNALGVQQQRRTTNLMCHSKPCVTSFIKRFIHVFW